LAGEKDAMNFVVTISVSSFLVVVSVQLVIVTAGGNKFVMSRITVNALLYTVRVIDRWRPKDSCITRSPQNQPTGERSLRWYEKYKKCLTLGCKGKEKKMLLRL
jgi:hypothetical protein